MGKINVGDWVTQYKAGYWMVKELHAKCSLFDSGGLHKGDPAGFIAVLQKALGSRFNFDMEMSACDLSLCSPVTKAEKERLTSISTDIRMRKRNLRHTRQLFRQASQPSA